MKEVNSVSDATNTYGEDIKLTTTDASTLYKTIITELEKGAGEPLYPGDERRIFGEALVPVFVALYNSLNDVGRQTLLRYARGEVLDAIGERQDVKRLEGTPAKTTMRFSVSTPQEKNIIIPKWTKVTPDSENYFATDEIAVLQAGAYSVEVPTSAVSNGTKFNGYAAGTITTITFTPSNAVLKRTGTVTSRMVFAPGTRNTFLYQTPYGTSTVGLETQRYRSTLGERGGVLELLYVVDFDHACANRNQLKITVREQ